MDKFLDFVADIFVVPRDTLSAETSYLSIPEWDSLMQIRLVAEIEDEYGVEIPSDRIAELKTLADFYLIVESREK